MGTTVHARLQVRPWATSMSDTSLPSSAEEDGESLLTALFHPGHTQGLGLWGDWDRASLTKKPQNFL